MSIHVQTGQGIDVVYDYNKGNEQVFLGIQPRNSVLIPMPDPVGFAEVLLKIAKECGINHRTT